MIQSMIETKASPQAVWNLWKTAYKMDETFLPGSKGSYANQKQGKMYYKVVDVCAPKQFTVQWKALFVKLVFTHEVIARENGGSKISYRVRLKGLLSRPLQFLIGNKIQKNLSLVLKSIVKELESR